MTAHDDLIKRLQEAKQQCVECGMHETAADFSDAIDVIEQQARDIEALKSDIEAQIQLARDAVEVAAMFQKDAEILETLIYSTDKCDLRFGNGNKVSSMTMVFEASTVPGRGMTAGVRRYLDAFMKDAAISREPT